MWRGISKTTRAWYLCVQPGTLKKAPTSLMMYLLFVQCYFKWKEKIIRAMKTNKLNLVDQVPISGSNPSNGATVTK